MQDWDAIAWGRALLRYFFEGYDAQPVSRLVITSEQLARAGGLTGAEASIAKRAFLRAVRCSPTEFRRHLSDRSLSKYVWDRREPPPFLAYLFFTCYAASFDADTADEGQFRERVRQLLRHPEGTSYSFEHLSRLWEEFANWLQKRQESGQPYRTLRLPDRGSLRRIGYSLRLAFPRPEDRKRLRTVLAETRCGPDPTVPEAFKAIAGHRERFSSDFRQVFEAARQALANGRDAPELQAVWSAILEAAALGPRARSRRARIRYRVLAYEDDIGRIDPLVVAGGLAGDGRHSAYFAKLPEPMDGFDHYLCSSNGRTDLIAKLLLIEGLEGKVPDFSASPIPRTVRDGVLLFRQLDAATWDLATTRPSEGRLRALVRTQLADTFLRLLSGKRHQPRESRFEGWREVPAFDSTELAEPDEATSPDLASVRCLQRVEIGAQMQLIGGTRLDGGYLGLSGVLPEVYCAAAKHVELYRISEESGESRITAVAAMNPSGDRPGLFRCADDLDDLEGEYLIEGTSKGRVVARRKVLFYSRGLQHDYKRPTDPAQWLVEASTSDVAPASEVIEFVSSTKLGRSGPVPTIPLGKNDKSAFLTNFSVDDESDFDRLVETIAAISIAKKGISEAELIETFEKLVRSGSIYSIWGTIRGWVEAGYVDCLTRRHWRGRVYFARHPRLVLIADTNGQSIRAVLHGLAPYRLRAAIRDAFARGGAVALPASSLSPSVPAPLMWRFESSQHASTLVREFGEISATGVQEPRELAGEFEAAVSDESPLPPGYELLGSWDWVTSSFRRRMDEGAPNDVRIEYHTRTNGPDRYVIIANERRRMTLSRSWALLVGFRYAGKRAFSAVDSTVVVRPGVDGPQVPLPVARAMALRAGIVGGPAESVALGRHYAYAVESASVQRWLLAWLTGTSTDPLLSRRFAWLRAAIAASKGATVPPRADLRRRLRALESFPDAHWIADRRIPKHLIAHLRRTVESAEN